MPIVMIDLPGLDDLSRLGQRTTAPALTQEQRTGAVDEPSKKSVQDQDQEPLRYGMYQLSQWQTLPSSPRQQDKLDRTAVMALRGPDEVGRSYATMTPGVVLAELGGGPGHETQAGESGRRQHTGSAPGTSTRLQFADTNSSIRQMRGNRADGEQEGLQWNSVNQLDAQQSFLDLIGIRQRRDAEEIGQNAREMQNARNRNESRGRQQ
jgi:hypothetical protein